MSPLIQPQVAAIASLWMTLRATMSRLGRAVGKGDGPAIWMQGKSLLYVGI